MNETPFAPKLWLAPLTFGGNLPFRRLCVESGAEVTVGEMAVVRKLLRGKSTELALLRRHPDEPCFGAQLADKKLQSLAEAARMAEARGSRFVDLNCGCPTRLITGRGLGAALLRKVTKLGRLVEAMARAVEIPVTVKLRTGWSEDRRNVAEVARVCEESGAAAITIHARSREQPQVQYYRINRQIDRLKHARGKFVKPRERALREIAYQRSQYPGRRTSNSPAEQEPLCYPKSRSQDSPPQKCIVPLNLRKPQLIEHRLRSNLATDRECNDRCYHANEHPLEPGFSVDRHAPEFIRVPFFCSDQGIVQFPPHRSRVDQASGAPRNHQNPERHNLSRPRNIEWIPTDQIVMKEEEDQAFDDKLKRQAEDWEDQGA